MPSGSIPTEAVQNGSNERKLSIDSSDGACSKTTSHDPVDYIQRARVTRPTPPKPSCNPMQFVQIKPCNLYQSAQQQVKRAEEVKKVMEVKKEEPEDWQSNLDNWKSSRRKRVEHIIDRVVEVKKLELDEHDRMRRKSKTFSEMLEERGSRKKLPTLPVYTEDESNDLSDLGIGTSSTSGKSSLSDDYDNNSVISDNADTEKTVDETENNLHSDISGNGREYISSPGYDTSTSTAPTSSPDPYEYTYEGAIQDYKTRISKAHSGQLIRDDTAREWLPSFATKSNNGTGGSRRISGTKLEERLLNFEFKSSSSSQEEMLSLRLDLPKVDISKRRGLFEKGDSSNSSSQFVEKGLSGEITTSKSIKERLSDFGSSEGLSKLNETSIQTPSLKDRLLHLESQTSSHLEKPTKIEVPVLSLKDRLSSLQSSVNKEETKKAVVLIDQNDLEALKRDEAVRRKKLQNEFQAEIGPQKSETFETHDGSKVFPSFYNLNTQVQKHNHSQVINAEKQRSLCELAENDNCEVKVSAHSNKNLDLVLDRESLPAQDEKINAFVENEKKLDSEASIDTRQVNADLDFGVSHSSFKSNNFVVEDISISEVVKSQTVPSKSVEITNIAKNIDSKIEACDSIAKQNLKSADNLNQTRSKTVVGVCKNQNLQELSSPKKTSTPFINVNLEDADKINECNEIESKVSCNTNPMENKNIENIILTEIEVVTTKMKLLKTEDELLLSDNQLTTREKLNMSRSTPPLEYSILQNQAASRPKNIFEFIKQNFSPPSEKSLDSGAILVDNSKFYLPSERILKTPEVSIKLTKTVTTETILEKVDSDDSVTMALEIDQLIDEELDKLCIEDTRL